MNAISESPCSPWLSGLIPKAPPPLQVFLLLRQILTHSSLSSLSSNRSGFCICAGVSLGSYAAGSDDPGPEGLTSTSLLDLLLPTGLESFDSEEPREALGLGPGLGAPGSGFPSEESEESRILQPPQYFWEEEEELNDSSLDLGPTAGSSSYLRICAQYSWVRGHVGKVPKDHFLAEITSLLSPHQFFCISKPSLWDYECLIGPGGPLFVNIHCCLVSYILCS